MLELAARTIDAFVGVGSEVIPLGLQQVGRQSFAAIAVVEIQSGGKSGGGDSGLGRFGDGVAPATLSLRDRLFEIRIKHQIGQLGFLVVGLLDVAKKTAADD